MDIMAILIIALGVLVLAHFIAESVVAPTERMLVRRELLLHQKMLSKVRFANSNDERAADILRRCIANLNNRLPALTISAQFNLDMRMAHDEEFRTRVERGSRAVAAVSDENLKSLFKRVDNRLEHAFMMNAVGWLVLVVPFVVVHLFFSYCSDRVTSALQRLIVGVSSDGDAILGAVPAKV